MASKGFGKTQPTKIDKLIGQAVEYSRRREPEALDKIFDNLPVEMNNKVLKGTLRELNKDIDTLSWLCGYFASEINSSDDNDKPRQPIILLSKLLMKYRLAPFIDFMPYTGCRITIINYEKFEALPAKVQQAINGAFEVLERSTEEAQQINDALLAEMLVD
ncbi:hypothetical protein DSM106972_094530 [Dulcicalothrix desertica PCC 7102]|uniref:Uncharacterized protein n=1 Tax=Dulcicalothrix desertica PCC 7102 TaxID=232991 RepID=A0A433UJI4_9CYAN|nr:hypothetical protein [Dulcicalothrix desertica]RUS93982.1 hypothetical protein DSM106972_094530 [Dulcicalothrix desertica PCC 7102]TWH62666.1 hypothetical protein CAL7102_00171 [Dulcicalothrix desertica PCC 7102]